MPKYSKKDQVSEQTKTEALAFAKGIQKPGQTKEQTKLVAQGIQKGIDLYKKQQKTKARELNKQTKKDKQTQHSQELQNEAVNAKSESGQASTKLPWVLLALSWAAFGTYLVMQNIGRI